MDTNLQEFSSTLKEFKQILQTTRFGSHKDFTTRENTKPLRELEEHPLSPELRYLYSNYITLLILPHLHINTYSSLFPKMHIFGKTGAMSSKHNPWKEGKVVIGHSFNKSSRQIWADTTQNLTPIYITDLEGNFMRLTSSINLFFKLLIELCLSYNENRDKEPKCGSHTDLWDLHREEIVSPYFANRIKDLIPTSDLFIVTAVFTQE